MARLYADKTAEAVQNDMLNQADPKIDKRRGSIIYDATAPASIEFEKLYAAIDYSADQTFADTAERPYLIRKGAERGLVPYPATFAKATGVFTPAELEIPEGSRFYCGEYIYRVSGQIAPGRYYLDCEIAGSAPNGQTGRLIPVQTIPGLKTAELVEISILGEDEEDTEAFRQRYYNNIRNESFGGNVSAYKEEISKIPGVGGVKIFPAWNGGGTVRCVIIDSEYSVPTDTLVAMVQDTIDPMFLGGEYTQGMGLGIAPIGHFVTIQGANPEVVNITTRLTYRDGYTLEAVRAEIEATIADYCRELNADWENQKNTTVVRLAEINARILLNVTGVVDITGTRINGVADNLVLQSDSITVPGTFSVTV